MHNISTRAPVISPFPPVQKLQFLLRSLRSLAAIQKFRNTPRRNWFWPQRNAKIAKLPRLAQQNGDEPTKIDRGIIGLPVIRCGAAA